jgi:hypothetical protein
MHSFFAEGEFKMGEDVLSRILGRARYSTCRPPVSTHRRALLTSKRLSLQCGMVITLKCSASRRYPTGLLADVSMRLYLQFFQKRLQMAFL